MASDVLEMLRQEIAAASLVGDGHPPFMSMRDTRLIVEHVDQRQHSPAMIDTTDNLHIVRLVHYDNLAERQGRSKGALTLVDFDLREPESICAILKVLKKCMRLESTATMDS